MKIGIVGYGVVGKATHKGILDDDPDILIHDPILGTDKSCVFECDIVFVCIPTDDDKDIKNVHRVCEYLHNNNVNEIIVRCTLPPGTCEKINQQLGSNVMFMPEFLRDRHWITDCKRELVLLGDDSNQPRLIKQLKPSLISVTTKEAEFVKLMNNLYATINIIFANHMYDWANIHHTNYDKIKDLFQIFRNGQDYLECNDKLRGFGGKCLPKDLDFAINEFKKLSLDENFFSAVKKDNNKWPITVRKD